MAGKSLSKYLIPTPPDLLWGITVTSTGAQTIGPGESYPPQAHPSRYLFVPERGRILDEFQFVYITSGGGEFKSDSIKEGVQVREGDILLLFPGEWHSYHPDGKTGWDEYWIGCSGEIPQAWLSRGIISAQSPILHPGLHSAIRNLYEKAASYAGDLKSGYQKVLGAIAIEILGISLFFDKENDFNDNGVSSLMDKAREMIFSDYAQIGPEDIASRLGIGYSRFRNIFKSYFGVSPGQYILNIRIANAKELLTNSSLQIQEIAWKTGFDNSDYFTSAFRRITGLTPGAYRNRTRNCN